MAYAVRWESLRTAQFLNAVQQAGLKVYFHEKGFKLAGQTYYRCEYAGIIFNTRDAEFVAAVRDKSLFSVTFAVEEVAAGVAADGTATTPARQYLELVGYQVFETETRRNIAETDLLTAQAAKFEAALRLRMAQRAGAQASSAAVTVAAPTAVTASAVA